MVKHFQKFSGLKINFTNTKDHLLGTISNLLGIDTEKFKNLSSAELAQIISSALSDKKKKEALLIAYKNPVFTSQFLSSDMERYLNNKNFSTPKGQSNAFPLSEAIYLTLKFIASANTRDALQGTQKRGNNIKMKGSFAASSTSIPSNDNAQKILR